jgi:hypothetical protein
MYIHIYAWNLIISNHYLAIDCDHNLITIIAKYVRRFTTIQSQ